MKVCSCSPQRQNKSILSFLAPLHQPASAKAMLDNNPGKSAAVGLLLLPPRLQTLLPSPDQLPPAALYRQAWSSGSATGPETNGTGPDGCLPELDMFPPVAKSCGYGICAFVLRCFFLFSHCTPQWSIVWGLIFFPPLSPHVNAVFFFHSLSSCSVYPVVRCMLCMYEQVDG